MSQLTKNNKPTLAYVVNSLNLGGTEQLVVQMGLAIADEYGVFVVCLDEPGLWAPALRKKGIPVYCMYRQPGIDIALAVKLAKFFREHDIAIVHAHQCTPWFYAALSRLLYRGPKLLFEEHGRFFPEVEKKKKAFFNKLIIQRLTDQFIAVSKDVKARIAKYEGVDSKRIEVVYNGANIAKISAEEKSNLRHQLGLDINDFIIGSVGRMDAIKNYPMFIKSLSQVAKKYPKVRGLLIGDGPEFETLKRLRDETGLNNTLLMPGYKENAASIIQCLDLFVLCSFSEGTSMALLEAMAAQIPVAVTDVGGNPELVEKDMSGWVVPSDSVDELTKAMIEVVTQQNKANAYAKAGYRRYEKYFTFNIMMDNYRKIYQQMLM